MSTAALEYLFKKEWTRGHGQCDECGGCSPRAFGDQSEYLGHKLDCQHAKAIESLGGNVIWRYKNESEGYKKHMEGWRQMMAKIRPHAIKAFEASLIKSVECELKKFNRGDGASYGPAGPP